MVFEFISNSLEDTKKLGICLANLLNKSDIVCLSGDLGTGKTAFTKFLAAALGVDEYVTSPSYTIVNEYNAKFPIYHFDVYRINDIDEFYEIGYEDYFYGEGITIIEWANMIMELIPESAIKIEIESSSDTKRVFKIDTNEEIITRLAELIKEMK